MKLSESQVVISGTSGGIGKELAVHFLNLGWKVTGVDILECPPVLAQHERFSEARADITNEREVESAFANAGTRGPIDAFVANAAITDLDHRSVIDLPYKDWREVLRVNVDGSFLTARHAAKLMKETGGGNIVFITSSLAFPEQAKEGDGPYCSSKAAIEMLARVMAVELAPQSVNVNTLFPSAIIDTGFFAHWTGESRADLKPPDILNETAAFLCRLPAGAVTGRSLDQERWERDPEYRATWEVLP